MPREYPNCNSLRVQRASRLNHIEEGRLENNVHLMTKEFRRSSRLANQDMRIINLTLEFIQNSSGHSVEGRPPSHRERGKSRKLAPCFMYGERVISRKYRRTQSAVPARRGSTATTATASTTASDSAPEEDDVENTPSSTRPLRPQSSPMRRPGRPVSACRRAGSAQAMLNLNDSLSDLSIHSESVESDTEQAEPPEPETLVEKHAPIEKQTDKSKQKKGPTRSKSAQPATKSTFLTQPPSSGSSSRPTSAVTSRSANTTTPRSRPSTAYSYGRIKNARILPPEMEILQRVVHLPPTSKLRQEKVMEYKKGLNKNNTQAVSKRFQDFLSSLPQKNEND